MLRSSNLSKSQIDRLGDRLRKGNVSQDDLRLLDTYRLSFGDAYKDVVAGIRRLAPTFEGKSLLEPTGREAKSTASIVAKLQRESIRLSQMQDIAGCRITVDVLDEQDYIVRRVAGLFENSFISDRRKQPSHGYRAVHVIVDYGGKPIEVQVRTSLQHFWAELSEKFSDAIEPGLKYGTGDAGALKVLAYASAQIQILEAEEQLANTMLSTEVQREVDEHGRVTLDLKSKILQVMKRMKSRRERIQTVISQLADVTMERRRR